ncbi:MAG: cob(I)yrinic acid a,c-diamide adenosyltransferase [Planctomycetes bacterium]|nr:cob(I)yrinic acid a,c-diamide adenosyltransferase [Planctomycetota bacterium]
MKESNGGRPRSARILLFTGDGKGKTTAALGLAARASGHGLRALVVQFIKSDPSTGEMETFRRLGGVEIQQTGLGFVPPPTSPHFSEHRAAAERGLALASEALSSGRYDLLVLDEVCNAVARGLLEEARVIQAIRQAGPATCVVMTGRGATEGLVSLADTVTEMRCVKHAYHAGVSAQKGVEF